MKDKRRKWIYLLVLMGLLLKFIITGLIVILTIRGIREERLNKFPDLDSNLQNTTSAGTQAWTKPNLETASVNSIG
jgi:cytoskeletal protein RodZ